MNQIRPISVEVVKMPNIGELVVENVSYARSKIVRLVELCLDEGPFHVSTLAECSAHRWRPATDSQIAQPCRRAAIRWSVGLGVPTQVPEPDYTRQEDKHCCAHAPVGEHGG